jgi:hypothetical protein
VPTKKVSSTVDAETFDRALVMTGFSQAQTLRVALDHFMATAVVAVAAKPVRDMSEDEKVASLKLLVSARRGLEDALVYLAGEAEVADLATAKRLRIQILDLEADIAKVRARITAFQAEQLTMVPPSPETVERIGELTEEVGRLTEDAHRADQVVAAAVSLVQIWTGTQV